MEEVILSKQTEKQFEAKLKEVLKSKLNQIHYDISDISDATSGPLHIKVIDWTFQKEKKTTIDWDSILANIDIGCEYESLTDNIIVKFKPQINNATKKGALRAMTELIDRFLCSGKIIYNDWSYKEALAKSGIIQTTDYEYTIKTKYGITTFYANKLTNELAKCSNVDINICLGKRYYSNEVKYTPIKIKRNKILDFICKPEIIQIEEYQELSDEQWQALFILNQIKGRVITTIVSELKQVLNEHSRFTKDEFIAMLRN